MKISKPARILIAAVLIFLMLLSLLPMMMVLINSFKNHVDIVKNPLAIQFTAGLKNYSKAWESGNFGRAILNSVVYTGSTVLITLLVATPCAYVIAFRKVKISGLILSYFMMTMTMPCYLFLVPLYRTYAKMGWLGNHVMVSFILAATSLPLAITLLRTFYVSIPKELEEAARIDGASEWRTFTDVMFPMIKPGVGALQVIWHVIFPVLRPGLVTVGIITGLNSWNEFLVSSTFLTGEKNFTAMLALMSMNGPNSANQGINMAATVTIVAPIILFFILMQRQFIDGMVSGSVKG